MLSMFTNVEKEIQEKWRFLPALDAGFGLEFFTSKVVLVPSELKHSRAVDSIFPPVQCLHWSKVCSSRFEPVDFAVFVSASTKADWLFNK